jgi:hypothetical protein
MPRFADHPDRPGARIWKRPAGGAIFSGIVALLCFGGALGMSIVALFALGPEEQLPVGIIVGLCALVMVALGFYVWRDMQGKRGGRIILTDRGIELDLKRNRSLAHRSPPFKGEIIWRDIVSLDHRLEAYGAQGLAMMQRSYWLVPRSGAPILLFEDRGIDSPQETEPMTPVFEEIAKRGRIGMVELGMARGRGGIMGAWFAKAPAHDAQIMSPQDQAKLWNRVWLTGSIASLAIFVVWLGSLLG